MGAAGQHQDASGAASSEGAGGQAGVPKKLQQAANLRAARLRDGRQLTDGLARSSGEQRRVSAELWQLAGQRRWREALELFRSVPEPSAPLWTGALDACAKAQQLEQAKELFRAMPERTVPSYNVMVALLGRMRRAREAEALVEEMFGRALEPNEVTMTSLITACGMVQDSAGAVRVLDDMEAIGPPRIQVTSVAYGAAMSACARAGDEARARALLARMDAQRLRADIGNFGSLVAACSRQREEARAREHIAAMRRRELHPDVAVYTSLLCCISGPGALSRGEAVFAEMRAGCIVPDTFAYNRLLDVALASGDAGRCRAILADMDAREVPRDEQTALRAGQLDSWKAGTDGAPGEDEPLPPDWHQQRDPASGCHYYWLESDPAATTTWERPPREWAL